MLYNGFMILIVEDDPGISRGLKITLEKEGYSVLQAFNASEALILAAKKPSLVLLDINLPDSSGFELCRKFRAEHRFPLIFLTARSGEMDQLRGYSLGCDDYITKPFSSEILKMKIKALLRRTPSVHPHLISGDIEFSPSEMKLLVNGEAQEISSREIRLLTLFMENPGQVFTKERLMDELWGRENRVVEGNTLTVAINRLRKKIEENAKNPRYLKTLFGVGFYWDET